ncbi:hypothetical protein J4H86_07985 [Spiractinospora alimapuensis]|uniref:hypothetical protein n=1 Tax=Spiractinospora alimapuensis TaxID=2820884 RepID=UPI001F26754E|nr:hypothetical protein [Spiractinospora alimapuensis]QVQ53652.1 hypothetical protein J4H86_07985 [Spiractinospora alimapuensis]
MNKSGAVRENRRDAVAATGPREDDRWRAAGLWGAGLAAGYAVLVRFYQAAGGEIGLSGTMKEEFAAGFGMASYAAGLLILLAGLACLVLTRPALRRVPRRSPVAAGGAVSPWILGPLCLAPVVAGGAYAVSHAISGTITKGMDLVNPGTVNYPDVWANLDRTSVALWDIFLYEPWFLAMGVCLLLSAWRYLRDHGASDALLRRLALGCVVVVVGLAAFSVWLTVMDMTVIV